MVEGKRHLHGGSRRTRKKQKRKPLIKPSGLVRLIHCHENSTGKTGPRDSVTPPGPSHNVWECWEMQFQLRFLWERSQTISPWLWPPLCLRLAKRAVSP